jgi:uncharacterized protein (UPF0335 family)
MSDMAPDLIRSYVDRILRIKEEEDTLKADIKDIYAEAKGNGLDKTALGDVVNHLRKQAKNPEKASERAVNFDLYLDAYSNAPSHAHAPAYTREG